MWYLGHAALLLVTALVQDASLLDRSHIEIVNNGQYIAINQVTTINGGPVVGNMLNAHYFPGINLYNGGGYKKTQEGFPYPIPRPPHPSEKRRGPGALSTFFFLPAIFFAYQSQGVGQQS